ncbi:hypothetical protein E2C01_012410 [Portunus trituberculatus]|uniref:Uncharacterized protein n=1 Tax=Portunus trituberculatus TaxID=210409 RepID=A0A5B7DEK8_PORTR|nr:hypothetical protein [Portunus trituberculatus]
MKVWQHSEGGRRGAKEATAALTPGRKNKSESTKISKHKSHACGLTSCSGGGRGGQSDFGLIRGYALRGVRSSQKLRGALDPVAS